VTRTQVTQRSRLFHGAVTESRCNVGVFHRTARHPMLEEALDPRPNLPLDFARMLTRSADTHAVSAETLAQIWNDDASFWSNLRTLEYWTDRARR
jgi:hypothetical protein